MFRLFVRVPGAHLLHVRDCTRTLPLPVLWSPRSSTADREAAPTPTHSAILDSSRLAESLKALLFLSEAFCQRHNVCRNVSAQGRGIQNLDPPYGLLHRRHVNARGGTRIRSSTGCPGVITPSCVPYVHLLEHIRYTVSRKYNSGHCPVIVVKVFVHNL